MTLSTILNPAARRAGFGELPHEQVLALMQRSKILLHTSSYEGFGCVCAEALYARANVMSFCRPMKAEIEQWHIVTDRNEMKEKALDLLLNPSTQYKSIKVYNIDEVAEKFRQLFAK